MNKSIASFLIFIATASVVCASNNFSYTATASPGSSPDGQDQNSSPVSVWTVTTTLGGTNGTGDSGSDGAGVYLGSAATGEFSGWQAYSYQNDGTARGGSVNAKNTFAGGALAIGQTVSLNFEMRALDAAANGLPAGEAGVSLLNGSGNAITFYIYGGGPNHYDYTDAGSTAANAGSMGYQYQAPFNIAFTVTGADTYSAVAGSDDWSGTFSGSLTGIDVFNDAGGNGSDVGFNNLAVTTPTPEPTTLALCAVGGLALLARRRASSK